METTVARDGQEIEWQFDARDLGAVERWLAARPAGASPAVGEARVEELTDTYLDTEDWRIHAAGFVLRVRARPGRAPEATLKAIVPRGEGPRIRREINELLDDADGAMPDGVRLLVAPGPVGQRLRALAGARRLRPLFVWRTRRQILPLVADGRPVGELSLDEGSVARADGAEPSRLVRVEVEAAPDIAQEALEPFVAALGAACGLRLAQQSKFVIGLLAAGLMPEPRPDPGAATVEKSQTLGEAAFAVLREQFRALRAHEPGTRLGEDPEALHDMRVASRRLRAAMDLFAEALPLNAPAFRAELEWVATALGEVRDLDVQREQARAWKQEVAPDDAPALPPLVALLEERRAAARERMLKLLDSRRYEEFLEGFAGFLQRGPTRRAGAQPPVLAAAPELIARHYRKVRRLAREITDASPPEAYHALRIRLKRLRYAVEFLAPLYGRPARALIRRIVALQDLLGRHQDACTAVAHLRELALAPRRKLPPATLFVMGQIAGHTLREAAALRRRFPKAYRKLEGRPWRALHAAMEAKRPADPSQTDLRPPAPSETGPRPPAPSPNAGRGGEGPNRRVPPSPSIGRGGPGG